MRTRDLTYDFQVLLAQYAEEHSLTVPKVLRPRLVAVRPLAEEVRAENERTGGWEDGRGDEDIADPVAREDQYTRDLGQSMLSDPSSVPPLLLGGPRTILSPGKASLWDGRHRVVAADDLGIARWPAIDLRDFPRAKGGRR